MLTTGIFSTHRADIRFDKYGDTVKVIPFGDVHRSSPLCHVEKWHEFLDKYRNEKNVYFLGMGDYLDLSSTSERRILHHKDLHESTQETLDDVYREKTDEFLEEIEFMRDKLLGFIEGNHYAELQSGITTTQYMAERMGCKYLGVSCFLRLSLIYRGLRSHCIDVWAHHGLGGGRTLGASINKLEKMIETADADIYLMGHDHRKSVAMASRLKINDGCGSLKLVNRKIVMCRTGAFLKGYKEGCPSYIADKALPPTDIGNISLSLTPIRKDHKGKAARWVTINATL